MESVLGGAVQSAVGARSVLGRAWRYETTSRMSTPGWSDYCTCIEGRLMEGYVVMSNWATRDDDIDGGDYTIINEIEVWSAAEVNLTSADDLSENIGRCRCW